MVKPKLVKPKRPEVELDTDRSPFDHGSAIIRVARLLNTEIHQLLVCWWNALYGRRPVEAGLRTRNGDLEHAKRLTNVKTGSPTEREFYGDGVVIVAKCPKQRLGQDEGQQVSTIEGKRYAKCV